MFTNENYKKLKNFCNKEPFTTCPECGLTYIPAKYFEDDNEEEDHQTYHQRYKIARHKYHGHVLSYDQRCLFVSELLPELEDEKTPDEQKLSILDYLVELYFTESISIHEFSFKHPSFEDFAAILWNSTWFLSEISDFVTDDMIEYFKKKYQVEGAEGMNKTYWSASNILESEIDLDNDNALY